MIYFGLSKDFSKIKGEINAFNKKMKIINRWNRGGRRRRRGDGG